MTPEEQSEHAVRVDGLEKAYRVYRRPLDRLVEWITRRRRHKRFVALEDISFELPRGESLGIVGENGAGKSTLLKILSGISRPSAGTVQVRGRIASILELGSGFHPEFTGRDNIRINAALLGLDAQRVEAKIPEIIAFSELGEFIDRPVKVYSTGMVMRLAFSVATQVDPDVLIVDEALSVGDGYFQKKCMDRMVELVDDGMTLLFCTHAMYYLTSFCHRAIWLRNGRIAAAGTAREVVAQYERFLQEKQRQLGEAGEPLAAAAAADGATDAVPAPPPEGTIAAAAGQGTDVDSAADGSQAKAGRLLGVRALEVPTVRRENEALLAPSRLVVEVDFEASEPETAFQIGLGLDRSDGTQVLSVATHRRSGNGSRIGPLRGRSRYTVRASISPLPLQQGLYTLYVFLLDEAGLHVWDQQIVPSFFSLEPEEYRIGLLDADCRFELVD